MIDIKLLASLAKIEMNESEQTRMERDMHSVIALIDTIADTEIPSPLTDAPILLSDLREDVPEPSMPRCELLSQHPGRKGTFFTIPKVV